MKFHDVRTELNVGPVKKLDIVNLIVYGGEHYCTEVHYWPGLEAMTVTLFSLEAYNNRVYSKLSTTYHVKTIFHLPVDPSDIVSTDEIKAPF